MKSFTEYLEKQGELIEKQLDRLIPEHSSPYKHLYEAARYSVLSGGKRLRPILVLATTDMLNGDLELALSPACTLEIVHTYSLIHDDLPCMDDDDYRRGKLTLHKKYSEGHAVLTGDFLLTYAFEILAEHQHLKPETKVKLISTLAKRIGSNGMIGGQVMDIASEGKKISLETLRLLHRNKTGALITASVEFGGIISNASEVQMESLRCYGENIGLAFQIIDDILDVTSSEAKHGRKVASDLVNEKSTYVTLLGIEKSKALAEESYQKAIDALNIFTPNGSRLKNLADFIINRNH
ncbi:MAG: polyprenyl synthetase family protein [Parachlamydiaceae bacterium]|nr:polyprenyl synthetase family protein [Parachlamydiaceae bacterium]